MPNPMFYSEITALDSKVHAELKISAPQKPLGFARNAHLIPALVEEFDKAQTEIGIAFVPAQPNPAAVFVCGVISGKNMYITDGGLWDGDYVPAYLRRYPFIVGDLEEDRALLCVDIAYEGFSEEIGEPLFDAAGERTEAIERGMALAQGYQTGAKMTENFCETLVRLDLLQSVSVDSVTPDGERTSVHGLLVVDEAALKKLGAEELYDLHQTGFLKAIYAHLASLRAISKLGRHAGAKHNDVASTEKIDSTN